MLLLHVMVCSPKRLLIGFSVCHFGCVFSLLLCVDCVQPHGGFDMGCTQPWHYQAWCCPSASGEGWGLSCWIHKHTVSDVYCCNCVHFEGGWVMEIVDLNVWNHLLCLRNTILISWLVCLINLCHKRIFADIFLWYCVWEFSNPNIPLMFCSAPPSHASPRSPVFLAWILLAVWNLIWKGYKNFMEHQTCMKKALIIEFS